ncbi:MAG: succinate dehydrogenase cytochrome b subunit [Verrucomicrobia bacterium]|nr:succinate dehydrogenase cytochrome b subunit [Verrucomicrobiota bacterium]MBV8276244.1 succinate dehydrogenase cytochrome b subunit [Verrucomicrobiota bacterium]
MSNSDLDPETNLSLVDGPVENPDITPTSKEAVELRPAKNWLSGTLSQKNLMALTGLFLCLFLVVHLLGNLQLLLPKEAAQWQFNFYSKLLSENIFIHLISYLLFATIVAHAVYALLITIRNRRAHGTRYEYDRRGVSSKWYSRKMGLLGTVILFFLIIHLRDFWYEVQFGHLPIDKDGQEDLYTLVVTVYRSGWYVLIYVLCMVALGYHLLHGFFSAARTLGVCHPRFVGWVRVIGWIYSVGISAGFALVPIYVHFALS